VSSQASEAFGRKGNKKEKFGTGQSLVPPVAGRILSAVIRVIPGWFISDVDPSPTSALVSGQLIEPKNLMKKYLTYSLTAFFAVIAVSVAAPDKDAIMEKEKAAWQAFKDKKPDDFKKVVSSDLVAVYGNGVMSRQDELETMSKTTLKSFSLTDVKVTMPDADTAVIAYKVKVESSMEGKDNSGDYNAASVWHKKNGEWQAVFHTDMKAESK
jgi:hypothetical protein